MATAKPLAIVAGAGAGLGQSLLQRFAAEGLQPVGLGRSDPGTSNGAFIKLDLADEAAVPDALYDIITEFGPPKIVVHNTAELVVSPFVDTELAAFQRCWASIVQTAVLLGQSVLEPMAGSGGGTFIVSGATASIRGGPRFAAFASAKFALRGLTQSLAREYQPRGVHVAHVILDGIIDTPRSRNRHGKNRDEMMNPKDIADSYWQLAQQPPSAWTHELDLRPASESF